MSAELAKLDPAPMTVQSAGESAALISMIERAARDPSVDIEKFERLMAMQERVEVRLAAREYNAALSAAKGEIGPIFKNRTVDFTSQKGRTQYRHEDLAEIARTVDPILKRHGLSYRWRSQQDGNRLRITCIVTHGAGHAEETTLESAEDHSGNKNPIQAIGSAATFLQRYTLKLALGLAATADDDGRSSGRSGGDAAIDETQLAALRDLIDATEADIPAFCGYFKIEKLGDLRSADFDRAMTALRKKAAKP